MKNIPTNIMVEKIREEPSMYRQLPLCRGVTERVLIWFIWRVKGLP